MITIQRRKTIVEVRMLFRLHVVILYRVIGRNTSIRDLFIPRVISSSARRNVVIARLSAMLITIQRRKTIVEVRMLFRLHVVILYWVIGRNTSISDLFIPRLISSSARRNVVIARLSAIMRTKWMGEVSIMLRRRGSIWHGMIWRI